MHTVVKYLTFIYSINAESPVGWSLKTNSKGPSKF